MMQVPGDFSHRPISGRFDFIKLNLKKLAGAITGQETKDKKAPDLDPRGVPALNLSVESLKNSLSTITQWVRATLPEVRRRMVSPLTA
ncbi:MAG: hypothetical protein KZQ66_09595 [Candidatus Thiodiazotropha sp. (ex Lucinoma aequizonata)]|nr:hypothetical protein [Candidatus Thiodiazotropha sp. (ex Lucinoma aequizonata)]MCU7888295.1 hypothetical protein [Candidatus Thiodiazotropha sp. (ex Lucinoma aequizonata)]MCU7902214.1 hypothetical protein [Candidatus Thiodiazotropha sp. (ex Lucinoma aequizonata)]MCU7913543.1 hypothetical protein [Candidatus Thiodiazotropha sp. (ex Lucinoma aequizonata)]